MKLWKSRLFKYCGCLNIENILQDGPCKNLIVFNYRQESFFLYKISDKNPGPIKLQVKNKNRILRFDAIDNFDFTDINDYVVFKHNYVLYPNDYYFIKHSTKSGILCRLIHNDTLFHMMSCDKEKVSMFFNTLRNL